MDSEYVTYVAQIATTYKAGYRIRRLVEHDDGRAEWGDTLGEYIFTKEEIEAEEAFAEKGYMKACQEIENGRLYDDKIDGFLFTSEASLNQAFEILHKHIGGTFLKTLNP